jgi:hypothetical protein
LAGAIPAFSIATIPWHLTTLRMTYYVIIKHHDEFSQSYLQGCEQSFDTEQQAQDYIQTFEDWEQDLLEIDFNPF